jgi:hypothetical protein
MPRRRPTPRPREVSEARKKEAPLARYRAMVLDTQTASDCLEMGLCPNDGTLLVGGVCFDAGCTFRLHVAPPPVVPRRVTFFRRWTPTQSSNRRYY